MQKAVIRALQEQAEGDPLGKAETTAQLETYLSGGSVPDEARRKYPERLTSKRSTEVLRNQQELAVEVVEEELEEHPIADPEVADGIPRIDKRRIAIDARTAILGENPRAQREMIRSSLPEGFYLCVSGKRSVRTLHQLGACYLLPDVDYARDSFAGTVMPLKSENSTWCARSVRGRASTRLMSLASRRFPHPRQRASRSDDGHWAGRGTLVT